MDSANLLSEIRAFREVLQKGKLTEIDLDALGDCLAETECTPSGMREAAENLSGHVHGIP